MDYELHHSFILVIYYNNAPFKFSWNTNNIN